jgi:hypothetical protein
MEKLLDFPKRKWSENRSKFYRFQCDCLSPEDAMDISVDSYGKSDEYKYFIISMQFLGGGFWERLKNAWQILTGHWNWREFIVRQDDLKNLSTIFDPDKTFSELP